MASATVIIIHIIKQVLIKTTNVATYLPRRLHLIKSIGKRTKNKHCFIIKTAPKHEDTHKHPTLTCQLLTCNVVFEVEVVMYVTSFKKIPEKRYNTTNMH